MKKALLPLLSLTLLSGCFGSQPVDFAGHYTIAEGNECKPDTRSANSGSTFIEITKLEQQIAYRANLPEAKKQGLPPVSMDTSPIDNAIAFTFSQERKVGLFNGQPGIEMKMTLQVNPTIPDSLVLSEWVTTMQGVGKSRTMDLLSKGMPKKGMYDQQNVKGICLVKRKTLT